MIIPYFAALVNPKFAKTSPLLPSWSREPEYQRKVLPPHSFAAGGLFIKSFLNFPPYRQGEEPVMQNGLGPAAHLLGQGLYNGEAQTGVLAGAVPV